MDCPARNGYLTALLALLLLPALVFDGGRRRCRWELLPLLAALALSLGPLLPRHSLYPCYPGTHWLPALAVLLLPLLALYRRWRPGPAELPTDWALGLLLLADFSLRLPLLFHHYRPALAALLDQPARPAVVVLLWLAGAASLFSGGREDSRWPRLLGLLAATPSLLILLQHAEPRPGPELLLLLLLGPPLLAYRQRHEEDLPAGWALGLFLLLLALALALLAVLGAAPLG